MGIIAENVSSSRVTLDNGGKNYIINGGFDYWDYATSQTSSGYGSDNRWANLNVGSTKTHSKVASTDTERALFSSPYYSRTVVTSVAGAGNYCVKLQHTENVTKLAGKTVTLSFWARADTSKNIGVRINQGFGTGGTPSGSAEPDGQLISLTSTWQKKNITFNIPSIIGKTLGTDGVHTSVTGVFFGFDIGSTYSTVYGGAVQQSGTFDIAEVKLEEGSVATPWTPYNGEFGGEVQACQRYYEILHNVHSTNTIFTCGYFKSNKRTIPTLTVSQQSGAGIPTYLLIADSPGVYQSTAPTGTGTAKIIASAEL